MLIRYLTWLACIVLVPVGAALALAYGNGWWWLFATALLLSLLGLREVLQTPRALLRNYPLLAHFRYLVESIRRFPNQDDFAARIRAAGFSQVGYQNYSGGIAALHTGWAV